MRRPVIKNLPARFAAVLATFALAAACAGAEPAEKLPSYRPEGKISGVIRTFGVSLMGMMKIWEEGFQRYHPDIRFENGFTNASAMAGLFTGVADIGASGREPVLTEYFSFYETFHYQPVEIPVATGAFDVKGGSYGLVVFVHQDNPITQLTLKQLDGIFGSERTGGYDGFVWKPDAARGAQENIRTWGQLGLRGEWADRPIQTYGYALTGMSVVFQQKVFGGGEKWNPNYREYIETGTKQVGDERLTARQMLKELSADKSGIAWTGAWQAKGFADLKPVALAARDGGPFVMPTKESFADRTYPLVRSVYLFINRPPGKPIDPKVAEFIRYVLSREGQAAVTKQGIYFSLPASLVREQLKKLD
jgi:phosphate transport system substrate-binding protein